MGRLGSFTAAAAAPFESGLSSSVQWRATLAGQGVFLSRLYHTGRKLLPRALERQEVVLKYFPNTSQVEALSPILFIAD